MADEDEILNFVRQTAQLRYSIRCAGLRDLLRRRGVDPARTIQHGCDQGDDVHLELVLPDGSPVSMGYREHYKTRQAICITDWEADGCSDPVTALAQEILSGDTTVFDARVRAFYECEIEPDDAPLPPLKLGDRVWHAWMDKPEDT